MQKPQGKHHPTSSWTVCNPVPCSPLGSPQSCSRPSDTTPRETSDPAISPTTRSLPRQNKKAQQRRRKRKHPIPTPFKVASRKEERKIPPYRDPPNRTLLHCGVAKIPSKVGKAPSSPPLYYYCRGSLDYAISAKVSASDRFAICAVK